MNVQVRLPPERVLGTNRKIKRLKFFAKYESVPLNEGRITPAQAAHTGLAPAEPQPSPQSREERSFSSTPCIAGGASPNTARLSRRTRTPPRTPPATHREGGGRSCVSATLRGIPASAPSPRGTRTRPRIRQACALVFPGVMRTKGKRAPAERGEAWDRRRGRAEPSSRRRTGRREKLRRKQGNAQKCRIFPVENSNRLNSQEAKARERRWCEQKIISTVSDRETLLPHLCQRTATIIELRRDWGGRTHGGGGSREDLPDKKGGFGQRELPPASLRRQRRHRWWERTKK
ncbi:hypothetical protein B0H14DRAFT_2593455 [Mycena olivaceomarginata]|nr:hypothetical protein B0H14DRAFT_2593455 [Mycena olivaceomarginata]